MITLSLLENANKQLKKDTGRVFSLFLLPRVLQVRLPEKQQSPVLYHSPDDKHCSKLRYSNNLNLHKHSCFQSSPSFFKNYQYPIKNKKQTWLQSPKGNNPVFKLLSKGMFFTKLYVVTITIHPKQNAYC